MVKYCSSAPLTLIPWTGWSLDCWSLSSLSVHYPFLFCPSSAHWRARIQRWVWAAGSGCQWQTEKLSQLPFRHLDIMNLDNMVGILSEPGAALWPQPTAGFSPLSADSGTQESTSKCSPGTHNRSMAKKVLAILFNYQRLVDRFWVTESIVPQCCMFPLWTLVTLYTKISDNNFCICHNGNNNSSKKTVSTKSHWDKIKKNITVSKTYCTLLKRKKKTQQSCYICKTPREILSFSANKLCLLYHINGMCFYFLMGTWMWLMCAGQSVIDF